MHICEICNLDCLTSRKLSYHIKNQHNISSEDYYRKYYLKPGEDLCENCGKSLPFIKLSKPFSKTCSRQCFSQNKLTKERRANTNIKKFGTENPFSSESIKEQIKNTLTLKYHGMGFGSEYIKEKIISTNEEIYGVDNPWKNKEIISELKQNRLTKIEQFELENDCIEKQKLIDAFGTSWLSIENTLDCLWLDNNHKFIKNYEIDKIKVFGPKFCRPLTNTLELEILDFIKSIYNKEIRLNDTLILDGKEIDIYISELNLGIEVNGDYYHSTIFKDKNYHFDKSNLCRNKNIRLIHIQEYLWKDQPQSYKDYLTNVIKDQNYFEIISQYDDYIVLNYNLGLPQKMDNYEIYEFSGPIKLNIDNYEIYGCGNVIYRQRTI